MKVSVRSSQAGTTTSDDTPAMPSRALRLRFATVAWGDGLRSPFRPLVRVAHRRPARPAPAYRGRSCRPLIGSLKEAWLVFARPGPMNHGGPGRQTVLMRRVATLPVTRFSPLPSPGGGSGEKREKGLQRLRNGCRQAWPNPRAEALAFWHPARFLILPSRTAKRCHRPYLAQTQHFDHQPQGNLLRHSRLWK